jgi:hypothetical protein
MDKHWWRNWKRTRQKKWVDWKVIIRCQYFGVKKRGGNAGTYSWDLRGGGGGGITIEKIPDLWWLVEHIDIRSRIPVQIVANKAQHMCHTFIHSFTYCRLHVGLLGILHLHHMCHTYIYIAVTSHVLQIHSFIQIATCTTHILLHAVTSHVRHIHSFIHSVTHTRSTFMLQNMSVTTLSGKFSLENSDPWKL